MKCDLRYKKTPLCYTCCSPQTQGKAQRCQEHYTPKGKHLTIDNRRLIERWKNENKSNREIAGLLGKAPQTIHNEVKRGTTLQQVRKGLYKKVYSADYAQTVYQFNRKRSVKKLILTKEIREKILHYHKHISKNFRLK
ncbi:transposase-like protein%2C IS1239 [Streptococcus pneumoniae]|nr:transposase-like protein%2C IS1239 [Streptococcus pneumoniae]